MKPKEDKWLQQRKTILRRLALCFLLLSLLLVLFAPLSWHFTDNRERIMWMFVLLGSMLMLWGSIVVQYSILPMLDRTALILQRLARLESMLEKKENQGDGADSAPEDDS